MEKTDTIWLKASPEDWERLRRGEPLAGPAAAAWARLGGAEPSALRGPAQLPAPELCERLARMQPVIELLQVLVYAFGDRLPLDTLRCVFADADGVVLWAGGGEASVEPAMAVAPQVGERWDEASRGTSALGTALALAAPVVVEGAGHLLPALRSLLCCAMPVRGPDGRWVGALAVSRPVGATADRSLSLVRGLVSAVEALLRRQSAPSSGEEPVVLAEALVDQARLPALMIDAQGQLVRANLAGVELVRRRLGGGWVRGALLAGGAHAEVAALNVEAAGQHFVSRALFGQDWSEVLAGGSVVQREIVRDGLKLRLLSVGPRYGSVVVLAELSRPAEGAALPQVDARVLSARTLAARLSGGNGPVLIVGERGTGRARLGRELALGGGRPPLVELDAEGAVWRDLEAALFGGPRGTPAGALRVGQSGAVLLREVGALPAPLQLRLLRWLRESAAASPEELRPRVILTGCADLRERSRVGSFRGDLYEIISSRSLQLPPLRERRDLEPLVVELLSELATSLGRPTPAVSPGLIDALAQRPWPGNVLELRGALAQAMSLAGDGPLGPPQLGGDATSAVRRDAEFDLDALTERAMRDALSETGGNVSAAAKRLGVARSTFYRMLERYALR